MNKQTLWEATKELITLEPLERGLRWLTAGKAFSGYILSTFGFSRHVQVPWYLLKTYTHNLKIIVKDNHKPGAQSQSFAIMIKPILARLRKAEPVAGGISPSFSHSAFP